MNIAGPVRGLMALAALAALAGCGTVTSGRGGSRVTTRTGCVTIVHGVVNAGGSLLARWLPAGFRPQAGTQPASALPSATYVKLTRQSGIPPRIVLTSLNRVPLRIAAGGVVTAVPVLIQGQRGLLGTFPPELPQIGAYWASGRYAISVVGYKVPRSVVLRVAQHVSFVAPGISTLPVTPGRIITRQAAVSAAERGASGRWSHAMAKLSSWAEIAALATSAQPAFPGAPMELRSSPWRPVWAVQLTGSQARASVVVVDAASGQAEFTIRVPGPWFAALTDRDAASTSQCPGGSSAQVPFGVLTRNEERASVSPPANPDARTSVRFVLSTVPAVNKADKSLYGGCIQQSCTIDQLVWVTITTVRANPGKTVACLEGNLSGPPGYQPNGVKQYYSVAVPGATGIGCGAVPGSLRALKDLAPPAA